MYLHSWFSPLNFPGAAFVNGLLSSLFKEALVLAYIGIRLLVSAYILEVIVT